MGFLSFIPKVGDGISWVTQKIIHQLASWGLNITPLQSKIVLIVLFGVAIYFLLSVLTIAKKIVKWGIFTAIAFLLISVIASLF